jgi:tetratricopeptide (TPR) repeat protein
MRNQHFTGRESMLNQLHERLIGSPEGTLVLHALQGLGGIGKTQLAAEYAHRFKGEYDLVWWIPAEDDAVTRASLTALADVLGVGSPDFKIAVRNTLEALRLGRPHARWLLIYDNATEPDQITEYLPAGGGHVLITSRSGQWRYRAIGMEVAAFSRPESIEFLTQRVAGLTSGDADRIAEALGDLPLALEQAAALQVESGISTDELQRDLTERGKELLAVFNENPPVGYPLTVGTVWLMSVEHLRTNNPDALELLKRLAFFGAEPIPLTILTEAQHVLAGDFGEILNKRLRLRRALRNLDKVSLAHVDTVRNTVQVHRLLQTTQRLGIPEPEYYRVRHDVHVLLSARAPSDPDDPGTWSVYNGFLGHVMQSGMLTCRQAEVREFNVNFARYLYVRGDYEGARDFAEKAIQQWMREPAEPGSDPLNDQHVLVMRRELGVVLRLLGELSAAYELNRETLERMRAVFGPEHEETLRIINSHGGDLRAVGKFDEAKELDEISLELHRQVFGELEHWTLMAANNVALDCRVTGDYHRALEMDRKTLEGRLHFYGRADNHWVLFSRNQIARDLRELGEYAESLALQRVIAAEYEAALDADHPNVLRAVKNLSVSLRKAGLYQEARQQAEGVRKQYKERFGADHIDTLAASCNVVNDLRLAGELEEARRLGEDTLARYRRMLGAKHPFSYGCAINVAVVLRRLGMAAKAKELDEQAHTGLVETVGPDNLYTLTALANLATDWAALGDLSTACRLGEEAVGRFTDAFDADHPYTLECLVNLTMDLRAAGHGERVAGLGDDPVHRLACRIGAQHPIAMAAVQGERIDLDFEPPPL